MYFIQKVVEEYGYYIFYLPLFIFYSVFIYSFIHLIFRFINKYPYSFYYPKDSASYIKNILFIYPERLCFDSIYYCGYFSTNNLYYIFINIIFNFIFGLPIFVYKVIKLLIMHNSLHLS
jgi:hypothetical protein